MFKVIFGTFNIDAKVAVICLGYRLHFADNRLPVFDDYKVIFNRFCVLPMLITDRLLLQKVSRYW